jgi:hypothetical protein
MAETNTALSDWEYVPNLLTLSFEQFSTDAVQHIAGFLGEPVGNVRTALGVIVPAIFAALLREAAENRSAAIFEMAENARRVVPQGAAGAEFLDTRSSLAELAKSGYGFSGTLFGAKFRNIESFVASVAEIRRGSSTLLVSIVTPLVLAFVERQLRQLGRDSAGAFGDGLLQQRDAVAAFAPSGLVDVLGPADSLSSRERSAGRSRSGMFASSFSVFQRLMARRD